MTSIAIMQPTFLPWIGYFALIDRVDTFVFLDHVQFEKRSWQQRNNIKTENGALMLSVPVMNKGKREQLIYETQILYEGNKSPFDKIIKTIEMAYKKAPFYKTYAEDVFGFMAEQPKFLSQLNIQIIKYICGILNINTPLSLSSDDKLEGAKEVLLANICEKNDADHYISPPGSKAYLENSSVFEERGIALSYHEYNHPVYNQLHGEFLPYMCILDLLFNEGADGINLIRSGLEKQ